MSRAARSSRSVLSRLVTVPVLVVLVAVSLGMFFVARGVVDDQEQRLLKERTDEVAALLANSIDSIGSSLRVLGGVASSADPEAVRLFKESARPLVKNGTVAVGAATPAGGGFRVRAVVGDGPQAGAALTGEQAALAARALDEGQLVSALSTGAQGSRLRFAVPASSGGRDVVYLESVVDPRTPVPPTPQSPFRELRAALYASPTNDPARLVLTTEKEVPLTGRVERQPFDVGADRWLLAVGARGRLVGSFAQDAPWLLLAGGLFTALLAAAMAEVLIRRRAYAFGLTAQRTAELTRTQAFLERLLNAGPVVVCRVALPARQVSYVSPNIERLFGISPEQALVPGFLDHRVHPEDLAGVDAALDRVAHGSAPVEVIEYRFGERDGPSRWVSAVLVPETDEDGEIVAVLSYVIDVDDRRRAEEAQRRSQEVAEAANRSKSQFLSRMSHELRTPLNGVLGFGQLLLLEPLTDTQEESVEQILKGGRHLLDLINEVLDVSRIEAGELALSPEAVLASELLQEAVDLIRPLATQRDIQLVVDRSGPQDCYVFADRQRTKQVLLNLLSNAVKYNRPHGTVVLACRQPSETTLRYTVADTGPGIPAERLGQLFTAFERLGAENTEVEGVGIGLALSKRLTEAMGGTLTVTSTLGEGSTFSVELPRVEGPIERYERLNPETEPVGASAAPRRKVIHIEDNLANLKLVERILEQRDDVEVIGAMHGSLGLELAHEHRPILILLDLHLRDMGGDEVLQRLREDPITASTPVVMVSADATPGQIRRLLAGGATAYLTKPLDVSELMRVLDEALRPV